MYDWVYSIIWVSAPCYFFSYYSMSHSLLSILAIWVILNLFPLLWGLEPIAGKDALFTIESSTNKLIVSSIAIFEGKISTKQYKACTNKALAADSRTKKYLVKILGRYYWKNDANFNLSNHYTVRSEKINKSGLENYVNKLLTVDLKPGQPPYEIHILKNYEGKRTAIVFRFHHAMADGLAIVSMMTWCGDQGSCKIFYSPSEMPMLKKIAVYSLASLCLLYSSFSILLQAKNENSLHSKKLSGNKAIAWSHPIDLKRILQYCKHKHVTFNDFLTAVVLEALEKYSGTKLGRITATIPFSLRGQPKDGSFLKLENDLTILPVEFPEVNDQLLEQCSRIYNDLKSSVKPISTYLGTRALVYLFPESLIKSIVFHVANKATLLFSNVGGPKGPVFYSGKKFESLFSMSPNMARCGISVTSFSYIDHFVITCYSDKSLIPYPGKFIEAIESLLSSYINLSNLS